MPTELVSCPYCNSRFPAGTGWQAGQRVACPRCGEAFAYHPSEAIREGPAPEAFPPVSETDGGAEPVLEPRPRWSNRTVALVVVALMGTMAVIGLTFAEMTTPIRREHDLGKPRDMGFAIPLAARLARIVYVAVLALFLLGTVLRKERPRSWTVRVGAGLVVALLGLVILDDALALLGYPSRFVPRRWVLMDEAAKHSQPTVVPGVAPGKLAGLGYLPPDTNLVLAVHVAEAIREPMGQELLRRFRLGPTGLGTATLEKSTGLRLEDLDHVVLGLKVDKVIPPRLNLVVRTRQPFDPVQLRAAMKADRKFERRKRELYYFPLEQMQAHLWCPDDRTLVIGLFPGDLDDVPAAPVAGPDHLPAPLAQLLNERLKMGTQLWFIGHADDWNKTLAELVLRTVPQPERGMLGKVQTFGLWLQLGESMSLNAAVCCVDAAGAEQVDKYLAEKGANGVGVLGLFGDPEQAAPIVQELARTLVRQREGNWADAQARAGAEASRPPAKR
jgi:hypothetical protein